VQYWKRSVLGSVGSGNETKLKWCFIIRSTFCSTQQNVALATERPEKCTREQCYKPLNMYSLNTLKMYSLNRYWRLSGNNARHNGQAKTVNLHLHVGQSVGLLVTRCGALHLFVDGCTFRSWFLHSCSQWAVEMMFHYSFYLLLYSTGGCPHNRKPWEVHYLKKTTSHAQFTVICTYSYDMGGISTG